MTPTPEVQERLRRYLLGRLADDEREPLEKELLGNDELFEELLIVEDEITDEYVAGELSPEDRSSIEKHFVSTPERQDKVRFARALSRATKGQSRSYVHPSVVASPATSSIFLRVVVIAVVVAIAGGIVWLAMHRRSSPPSYAMLSLSISQPTRSSDGSEVPAIHLPLAEGAVRIVMELPKGSLPAAQYRVQLETNDGEKRFVEPVMSDEKTVTVVLRAGELKRGQYALSLFAISSQAESQRIPGSYRFNVQ